MAAYGSVLVIRLSSLGDVLFAVPAVQALAKSGVATHVAWLVEDRARALLSLVAGLDEVLVFPRRSPARWWSCARALRARQDDVVLDLQCNAKSRLLRRLLRAKTRLGFDAPFAKEGGEKGLSERFLPTRAARHKAATNLAILQRLGLEVPAHVPRPALVVPPAALAATAERLAGLPGEGPLVVLHPGTSAFGELKRWPPERFAALADALAARAGARLLVSAGPGEEPLAQAVAGAARQAPQLVPPSGLPDLAALLAAADLVVAADSFPLHLANALGTPVVGLYGPKDPAVTGPCWEGASVVQAGVACSPCTLRRCGDRICMERLLPEAVLAACLQRLAAGRPRAPLAGAAG